jgi:hypothetical protein
MKTYEGVDVQVHVFSTSALVGMVIFTPRLFYPGTHWIWGWVGPKTGLEDMDNRKFLPLPELELRPLGRPAPSQSLYRLRYPGPIVSFDKNLQLFLIFLLTSVCTRRSRKRGVWLNRNFWQCLLTTKMSHVWILWLVGIRCQHSLHPSPKTQRWVQEMWIVAVFTLNANKEKT